MDGATPEDSDTSSWLPLDGEMAVAIGRYDWSGATSLGPLATWPESLRALTRLMLSSAQPMFMAWGDGLVWLYNDAFIPILGDKHPGALGKPALEEVWSEARDDLAPLFARVFTGMPVQMDDLALELNRDGELREAHFSFSYTPARDEAGDVRGLFGVCTETTRQALAERLNALATQREHQQFEQAPGFICVLEGPDHVYTFTNATHRRLFGRDMIGKPVREAFPELAGQGLIELLDQVYETGEPAVAHAAPVMVQANAEVEAAKLYLDFVYQPVRDAEGRVYGIFCEGFDASAAHLAQSELIEREAQLRLATEAAEVGLWDVDVANDTLFWPPRVKAMFGISPDVAVSMADFYAGIHPEDRERTSAAYAAAADPKARELYDVEYRTIGKEDGVVRWVAAKGRGVFDGEGHCVRVIGTAIDITRRKAAEEHLRLMVNELDHRVKNSLAIVQAMVTQTLRGSSTAAATRDALLGRIMALAGANDVLTKQRWSGADLREVADLAAAPFNGPGRQAITIDGPEVLLPPRAAIASALAFHELATNAAKYGALSTAQGQVRVEWKAERRSEGVALEIEWRETGGPPITSPERRGFGTRLIERSLSADLGRAAFDFRPEGLVCRISAVLTADDHQQEDDDLVSTRP